ncbi:MAG: hypothetical protein LBI26_01895 [Holosporales bacterium]|jgi:hypothetical protein|nr:hypothetical protein [Holosporales bacterium]
MQKIGKIAILFLWGMMIDECYSFNYTQLPITVETPKIHSMCFVIASIDAQVIMFEKNSIYKVYVNEKYSDSSIREIAATSLEDEFISRSSMSGITSVITYKNKNNCKFKIVFSGENSDKELEEDIKATKTWLDQFFTKILYDAGEVVENIPLICGKTQNYVEMKSPLKINVILSKKQLPQQFVKRIRYKSVVKAPITIETNLGDIFLETPLFKNPVCFKINANQNIKQDSKFKTVCDSIKYLIFGPKLSIPTP